MQNKLSIIAGALLGLLFIVFGLNFFLHFIQYLHHRKGIRIFYGSSLYDWILTFVKVLEILGGVLVAIPKTQSRTFDLGPIIVNIRPSITSLRVVAYATSCCSTVWQPSSICRTIRIP